MRKIMKGYTKKQMELVERLNETSDLIDEEKNWLEIASSYCDCENEDENFVFKMGLILTVINNHNKKLYNFVDDLLCDLNKLI